MRGLAFPSNAVFDRETSYEYGSPFSNVEPIPIDPALGGPAIDPAIVAEGSNMNRAQSHLETQYPQRYSPPLRQYSQEPRQYSQGPQGDPFAPQLPAVYLRVEPEQLLPAPKPVKRKRKPRREEDCGFCQGNDSKNKNGEPELMITCEECGRSGHPSCMELADVSDVVRSYPWRCIECKSCEICREKGDDERILFCDFCDRGWHMDCMVPRIETAPNGRWHCPECPVLGPGGDFSFPSQPELQPEDTQQPSPLPIRESSTASSSRSFAHPTTKGQTKYRGKGKGKARVMPTDDSELEVPTPPLVNSRIKRKSNRKNKSQMEGSTDDEDRSVSPPRRKRMRSPAPPLPRIRLRLAPQKSKGKERDDDEPHKGLFDGILRVGDRDTTKTVIQYKDKQWFERSRLVAEEKLAPPALPLPRTSEIPEIPTPGPSSRPLRSSTVQLFPVSTPSGLSASPAPSTPSLMTKVGPASSTLRIRTIRFGQFDIKTWYDAPFPEEYATIPDGRLWICEFCLKYMKSRFGAVRHRMKCKARHPPGDEIYRDGTVSIFEVDGRKNKIYCQNLCLLSKMFLDHKSLFYDVEPFLFYVMTEVDDFGARFVGYFSKEKRSPKDYNVSCIMTLPVRQRQGWGNLLIDFSYLLSKKEQRLGSPEKPLSSLGALGYKNYWTLAVMRYLETAPDNPRLADISAATSMTIEDVHATLTSHDMISVREITPPPIRPSPGQSIKFPKGRKNGVARRHLQRTQTKDEETLKGPFVAPTQYDIHWDRDKVDQYLKGWEAKGYLKLKPEKLKWSPFLLARTKKTDAMGATKTNSLAAIEKPAEVDLNVPNGKVGTWSGPSTNSALDSPSAVADDGMRPLEDGLPVLSKRQMRVSRSPNKEVVWLEQGRVLVRDPLDTPKRQLRSRSNQFSTPSTHFGSVSTAEGRSTRKRPIRMMEKQRIINDDEALATKLALEEQQQGRQLRSRAESTQELKRMVSTSSARSISPRKRRRVESSPEVEDSPSPPPLPAGLATPVNGKNCGEARRKPSRLMNGSEGGHSAPQPLTSVHSPSDVDDHAPVNAVDAIKHITSQSNTHVEGVVQTEVVELGHGNELDMKSEDLGTPLTSLTSRQSPPSDDTVFAADATIPSVNLNGKDPNGGTAGHGVTSEIAEMIDRNDDECDIDADGEYEEDAEGEPDTELIEDEVLRCWSK